MIDKQIREPVQWFAVQMEETLQRNDHKGGWEDCSLMWLFGRLQDEVSELEQTLVSTDFKKSIDEMRSTRILRESTDVANFAMMISDRLRTINAEVKNETR